MRRVVGALLIGVLIGASGCAETRHVTSVDKSGFLGKELYSKMTPGDESKLEPALRWRDDTTDWHSYTKLILDPIVVYRQPQHLGGGNTNDNAQMLVNYFYNKLYLAASKQFEMVTEPGPGTLRMQAAITDYEQSWVGLDMISTVVPQLRATAELKGLATGKPSFVGGVQVEAKVSDSQTGRALVGVIDRRVGGKSLGKGMDSWSDVKNSMDFWCLQFIYRACVLTGKPNCVKPSA